MVDQFMGQCLVNTAESGGGDSPFGEEAVR